MLWFVLLADYIVLVWWHACLHVCIHADIAFAKEKVGSYFSNSVEKQEWEKSTRTQIDVHARDSKDTPLEGSKEKLELEHATFLIHGRMYVSVLNWPLPIGSFQG